eukprot:4494625-Prymnesium_polylepis.1
MPRPRSPLTHTERHTTAVLGRAQRGEPGHGPHVFVDGSGYVSPKKVDYHGALQRAGSRDRIGFGSK